jgi:hypothetical protein
MNCMQKQGMLLNTESQYSSLCLIQRVTTPSNISSRVTVNSGESFLKFLKPSPVFKGTLRQKNQLCTYVEHCLPVKFRIVKNMGGLRVNF